MVGLNGRLLWASDPLSGAVHDAKAIAVSGILEEIDPSRCIADEGYIGTDATVPYKKPPKGELTKAQKVPEPKSLRRREGHRPHQIMEDASPRLQASTRHLQRNHHRRTMAVMIQDCLFGF